jgi:hypothetical protein
MLGNWHYFDKMVGKFSFSLAHSNKLEGLENYIIWKVKMKMIFRREKLWDVILQVEQLQLRLEQLE